MSIRAIAETGEAAPRRDLDIQVADASVTPPGGPGDVAMATTPRVDTYVASSNPAINMQVSDNHARVPEAEVRASPYGTTFLYNFDGTKYIVEGGRYRIEEDHVDKYVLVDQNCYADLIKGRVKGCPFIPVDLTPDNRDDIVKDFSPPIPATADSMGKKVDTRKPLVF